MIKSGQNWTKMLLVVALSGVAIQGVQADHKPGHAGMAAGANAYGNSGADERIGSASRAANGEMVMHTINEEKTEIATLAAQQAQFLKMGGRENKRIASLLGRMIRDHKAASPTLMKLAAKHGADPNRAQILKPPVLGDKGTMLHATMVDHMKAEDTSQIRHKLATDGAGKKAMHKRAGIARKHMRWMTPYHSGKNCPQCAQMMGGMKHGMGGGAKMQNVAMNCPHCKVKMSAGKCPMCGMTMEQMKQG